MPPPACRPTRSRISRSFAPTRSRRLNTYYWIDRDKGIVHIPIERGDEASRRARHRRLSARPADESRRCCSRCWPLARVVGRAGLALGRPRTFADFAFRAASRRRVAARLPSCATSRAAPCRSGDFFTGKPVVLVLEYLRCRPLCGVTLGNLAAALGALPLDAGARFHGPRDQHRSARHAGRRGRGEGEISRRATATRRLSAAGIS